LYLTSLVIFVYTASQTSLVMLTVDRFWAIHFPFSYHSRRKETLPVLLISSWVIPLTLSIVPLTGWNRENLFDEKCIATSILDFRVLFLCTAVIVAMCILMIAMYCSIYLAVLRQVNEKNSGESHYSFQLQMKSMGSSSSVESQNKLKKPRGKEIKMAKNFAWIILVFIICYTPMYLNFIISMISKNDKFFHQNSYLRIFHLFSICIAHFNSVVNPFIYAYKIKPIRDRMKTYICCRK
jgi:hypothetical protein